MTKSEYLSYRNNNSYPLSLYYEYFNMNGGKVSESDFNYFFPMFSHSLTSEGMTQYYDQKFEVVFLYKKQKLIKIY
jgi:hypothetical protein